ncbi:MAG: tetratricopeptide repeat protein [Planctomycetaceae bacterium]|nr:tetratricopeptide repeat protein [Planctomycetaceae bacterium]
MRTNTTVIIAIACLCVTSCTSQDQPRAPDLQAKAKGLCSEGRFDLAEALYKEILAEDEKKTGPDDVSLTPLLDEMAGVAEINRNRTLAISLYERSLLIKEKAYGKTDKRVAFALIQLGKAKFRDDQPGKDVCACFERAVDILEKVVPPDPVSLSAALEKLGLQHSKDGSFAEAKTVLLRCLEIREKSLGGHDSTVTATLNNLAILHETQGQFAQAESFYTRALAVEEKALGPDNVLLVACLNHLAYNYGQQGLDEKALLLYQRALLLSEKAYGPDDMRISPCLKSLADTWTRLRKFTKAEALYLRCLDIYTKALPKGSYDFYDHSETVLLDLAEMYEATGKHDKASDARSQAEKMRQQAKAALDRDNISSTRPAESRASHR